MNIHFYKYQGTGNDFILLDNRAGAIMLNRDHIAWLCNRHLGIGADGLMLLTNEEGFDFRMVYYNSDGNESTMCGNGGRCIVAFAAKLDILKNEARFVAIDGAHFARILDDGRVSLSMTDVSEMKKSAAETVLNTGSPHLIHIVDAVKELDVVSLGRALRHRKEYEPDGINVNFVQLHKSHIEVRTYERGVENETLSCGTGVTAAAMATAPEEPGLYQTAVVTPGGQLEVKFERTATGLMTHVWLTGPAAFVFEGEVRLP